MTQDQIQTAYDRALIFGWRKHLNIHDVNDLFYQATELDFSHELGLLRAPLVGFPWKIPVRVFVATHLDKINTRLWDQKPEKDEALIEKLKSSKYTTHSALKNQEFDKAKREAIRNTVRVKFNTESYKNRNANTDWKTVK